MNGEMVGMLLGLVIGSYLVGMLICAEHIDKLTKKNFWLTVRWYLLWPWREIACRLITDFHALKSGKPKPLANVSKRSPHELGIYE